MVLSFTLETDGNLPDDSTLAAAIQTVDDATELDPGDPNAFGRDHADLRSRFPQLTILGGCCGTDLRHIEQIATTCLDA